jgi:hypothetical protein
LFIVTKNKLRAKPAALVNYHKTGIFSCKKSRKTKIFIRRGIEGAKTYLRGYAVKFGNIIRRAL